LALAYTDGIRGLTLGVAILHGLVEGNWDALFPPVARTRARIGIFEWLIGRTVRLLPPPEAEPQGDLARNLATALEALDRVVGEKLPGGVAFGELLRPVRRLADAERALDAARAAEAARNIAGAPPAPPAPAIAPAAPATAVPAAPAPPLPLATFQASAVDGDLKRAFATLRSNIRDAALAILAAEPAEPRAYMLLRCASWLHVTRPPPARDGRTDVPPPPDIRRREFAALGDGGKRQELVLALEAFCSGPGIFWLDGQRLICATLAAMGDNYTACARTIVHALAGLLDRIPGLAELSFADGSPFADPATRAWLARETAPRSAPTAGEQDSGSAPWHTALDEARASLVGGKLDEAVGRLSAGARTAETGRARFFWQLAQAKLCIEAGAVPLALATLRHLDGVIDRHDLENWEPEAAAESTLLLRSCLTSPSVMNGENRAAHHAAAETALARLIRTDPVMAARTLGLGRSG
jgi:type VI secretion system protein VasJ